MWLLMIGDPLIQVTTEAGLTVHLKHVNHSYTTMCQTEKVMITLRNYIKTNQAKTLSYSW